MLWVEHCHSELVFEEACRDVFWLAESHLDQHVFLAKLFNTPCEVKHGRILDKIGLVWYNLKLHHVIIYLNQSIRRRHS